MNKKKIILLFGAGKSTSALIKYLLEHSSSDDFELWVADANPALAAQKIKGNSNGRPVQLDISNAEERAELIRKSDVVISMMPPSLHILVAGDCLKEGKNLLTASYADQSMKALDDEVREKGLLFLCEMGLDPGIDHMSAMQIIEKIRSKGGRIHTFNSHCGGLVAPQSDDNPWHYKITWNPRNVVLAGKGGARFLQHGQVQEMAYSHLFDADRKVSTGNQQTPYLSYYPNRDSLPYISLYGLTDCQNFMRTTLRYPEFMSGWLQMIELGFTDEALKYQTNNMSIADFLKQHLRSRQIDFEKPGAFITPLFAQQLEFLGLHDHNTMINLGEVSIIDIVLFILQKKLVLNENDKDLVVMIHEFGYDLDGKSNTLHCALYLEGEDQLLTAMAKTVGLPLGIAARMILNGSIKEKGVHIPIRKEIYTPVLNELSKQGVRFIESEN